jgi:hypothetical protein
MSAELWWLLGVIIAVVGVGVGVWFVWLRAWVERGEP